MRFPLVLAAWTIVTVISAQPALAQLKVYKSGVHSDVFKRPGQPDVRYLISLPKGYAPASPVPMILALHPAGNPSGAAELLFNQLIEPALKDVGAVIVAPESLGAGWDSAPNESAAMALLDAVQATYSIDSKRIAVTGYSLGGIGSWTLAIRHPERFSAAIPVSGRPVGLAARWKTPVYAINSRDDEVVPIEPTRTRMKELQDAGINAQFIELKGLTHYDPSRFADALKRAVPWLKEVWK